jgi:hypothetical protein
MLFPVNADRCVAEIPVAGGKRNTFSQINFHSYRLEFFNQFISDYLKAFSKCTLQFIFEFVISKTKQKNGKKPVSKYM